VTAIIGFAGKGGVGKTSLGALFLKGLIDGKKKVVLAIDSDPNESLPVVLGIQKYLRLSDVVRTYEGKTMDPEKFSDDFATMLMENEQEGYDILVMGRGESEGCYCLVNHMLRSAFDRNVLKQENAYDCVLMDCEAGIEHISRKTSTCLDSLIIVSDSSKSSLDTIRRILEVSKEVKSEVRNFYVVGNKVQSPEIAARIRTVAEENGMEYLGEIPYDPILEEYNFEGKSLLELPEDSAAYRAASRMLDRILGN
jgi:CO dehydrogenase maturation factor